MWVGGWVGGGGGQVCGVGVLCIGATGGRVGGTGVRVWRAPVGAGGGAGEEREAERHRQAKDNTVCVCVWGGGGCVVWGAGRDVSVCVGMHMWCVGRDRGRETQPGKGQQCVWGGWGGWGGAGRDVSVCVWA